MKKNRIEYWSVFRYGGCLTQCSTHRTEKAARRAAIECEKRPGVAKHIILRVEYLGGLAK